jgi:hypothetical protein
MESFVLEKMNTLLKFLPKILPTHFFIVGNFTEIFCLIQLRDDEARNHSTTPQKL